MKNLGWGGERERERERRKKKSVGNKWRQYILPMYIIKKIIYKNLNLK
jgi:hypothetical protein